MTTNTRSRIYIVDGSGYIFRAFFAVAPLTTRDGFPTNALFGFSKMLLKLLKEADSEHVIVVFDAGRETFRNELFQAYKANREECPHELSQQMPHFAEIVRALGLPVLQQVGFEADDIIATLVDRYEAAGHEVVVVTADKDLMQLVSDNVTLWDTMRDRRVSFAEVKEKFGVSPDKVVEVLGLIGDTSDNVPGIKGVGEKTAAQLIELYGTVEGVIAQVSDLKLQTGVRNRIKIAEQIEQGVEQLRLSRRLVEVVRTVPVEFVQHSDNGERRSRIISDLSDEELFNVSTRRELNQELLHSLIERFSFQSIERDFGAVARVRPQSSEELNYRTILKTDFAEWLQLIQKQTVFALDLETTSLDPHQAAVVGLSFCWGAQEAWYLPVAHEEQKELQMPWSEVKAALAPLLENPEVQKIGQNLKFDAGVLSCQGIQLRGIVFDTMIAGYLLSPDRRSFTLTTLCREYLNRSVIEYDEVTKDRSSFAEVPIIDATRYAAEDAHMAWLLRDELEPLLESAGLNALFREIEVPLVSVLSQIELRGMLLDCEMLKRLSEEYEGKLSRLQHELFELAGCEFNLNSPKQLSEVLFEKLGIPTKGLKKTKTGVSTDSSVLEQISELHPLPKRILEYRMLHKLKSTYVDSLPLQVSPVTGRLHTRLNQTGTGTGRLSSSDPNLQNIPIQNAEGRRVREAFIAKPGHVLISADYSQIELRLLAHLSGDEALCRAFTENRDIHEITTREILDIPPMLPVTSEQRRLGKTINFGIIYGMSAFRLSKELDIPVSMAQRYIDNYFARYPKVKGYFSSLTESAETKGYVTTITGRRREIRELETEGRDRGFMQRVAVNAPIQGSAADLIKIAMIAIERGIENKGLSCTLLLQIHDELLFECPESEVESAKNFIRTTMEGVMKLDVPLLVQTGSGLNWDAAH